MILKIVTLILAITHVRADYNRNDAYESELTKASEGLAAICEKKEPVIAGCRECKCGANGYEIKCKSLDNCVVDTVPPLVAPPLDDSLEKFKEEEIELPIICKPRSSFTEYCNFCRCSDSGKNKACTVKYCPPGVFNEDGTLDKTLEREYLLQKI